MARSRTGGLRGVVMPWMDARNKQVAWKLSILLLSHWWIAWNRKAESKDQVRYDFSKVQGLGPTPLCESRETGLNAIIVNTILLRHVCLESASFLWNGRVVETGIDMVTLQRAMRSRSDRVLPQIRRVHDHKIGILEIW